MKKILTVFLFICILFAIVVPVSAYSVGDTITYGYSYNDITSGKSWILPNPNSAMKLFYSNDPEFIYTYCDGIMNVDSSINGTGKFRVYWCHKHLDTVVTNKYIGFAIFNNTGQTIKVNLGKRGHAEGSNSTVIGRNCYSNWLSSSSSEYTYATVSDGWLTYISFVVPYNSVGIGMYDVYIRDTSNNLVQNGVTVKTFNMSTTRNIAQTLTSGNFPTLNPEGQQLGRGRANYSSKSMNISMNKNTFLRFTRSVASWTVPANDLLQGYSPLDSSFFYLYGSYGQNHTINLTLTQDDSAVALVPCLPSDQSGLSTYYMAAKVDGVTMTKSVDSEDMWIIATGDADDVISIQTSLPSFSFAPMRLVVIDNQ